MTNPFTLTAANIQRFASYIIVTPSLCSIYRDLKPLHLPGLPRRSLAYDNPAVLYFEIYKAGP